MSILGVPRRVIHDAHHGFAVTSDTRVSGEPRQ
jgi:hypothetical protein